MDKSLKKIALDSTSGSSDLLIKLAILYRSHLKNIPELKKMISSSKKIFVSFAAINNYLRSIEKAIDKQQDINLIEHSVLASINNKDKYSLMYENASPYLKKTKKIFTFSNSRTVLEIIILLKKHSKKDITVFVTESRPKNEGRILARKLLQNKIKVEFGTDSQMAEFISQCHAVFCGTDTLLAKGGIINKTGSRLAAIAAEYYKIPFFVFTDSEKISSSGKVDKKKTSEVWRYINPKLKIHNTYFEKVPLELISIIFTEKSVLSRKNKFK